jgi:hypothetical protein
MTSLTLLLSAESLSPLAVASVVLSVGCGLSLTWVVTAAIEGLQALIRGTAQQPFDDEPWRRVPVRLQDRRGALRCGHCHGPADWARACTDCGTRTHGDCRLLAGGCPTPGCGVSAGHLAIA